jgi:hypothetical protein
MRKPFEEADLSALRPISIETRASKVRVEDVVDPGAGGKGPRGAELAAFFPDLLGAASLKRTAEALRRARDGGREIVWLMGAHVIKVGLSGYVNALVDGGFITCLATTGSATIHDLELAFFGRTSEDVAAELPAGRFGMARETSAHFNAAIHHAVEHDLGLGAGVGAYIEGSKAPHARTSVFAGAHRRGIPATVHVAFGTDITHPQPDFPAAEAGRLTMRDFRVLAHRVGRVFDGGVVILVGSAVVLPEVFLKAVSVAYNLGAVPRGVFAAGFDMMPQYRVRENVLSRPFQGACESHMITGHHEIMLPLLHLLLRD